MNYVEYLPQRERDLYNFCVREDLSIADILKATGAETVKDRSMVNNVIAYSRGVSVDKKLAGRKRKFTGYQVLSYAVMAHCYRSGLVSADMLKGIYEAFFRKMEGKTGNEIFESSSMDRSDAAKLALSYDYTLLRVWLFGNHTLLTGLFFDQKLSIWTLQISSDFFGLSEAINPNIILIDLNNILLHTSKRLKDLVPEIQGTQCHIRITSLEKNHKKQKYISISGAERVIIEKLREQIKKNRGGINLAIKTDFQGKIKELRYEDKGISPKESAHKLFEAPETLAIKSIKGSDGKIAKLERTVKIAF